MHINDLDSTEEDFMRSLEKILLPDFLNLYLNYIIKVHKDNETEGYSTIVQAFEYVLNLVGLDPNSGFIYHNYISYLQKYFTTVLF